MKRNAWLLPALYVLFADGHVEHLRVGQFNQFLRQTLEHLGR